MPFRASSRTSARESDPGSSQRPPMTKNDASSRRRSNAGRAISTSDAFPSSNVSRTAGLGAITASISSKAVGSSQKRSSFGSNARCGLPMP